MVFNTFILGLNHEDIADFMNNNPGEIEGAPIFVTNVEDLRLIDLTSSMYKIVKTTGYWASRNLEKIEETLLQIKSQNYKGSVFFVSILDVIMPCMGYSFSLTSALPEWPEQVPRDHVFHGTVTTIYGRVYEVYCGRMSMKSFCGSRVALTLMEPLLYTGGFA